MINKNTYEKHLKRIDKLLLVDDNNTSPADANFIELVKISNLVADYEEKYYPNSKPSLIDVTILRVQELSLK